MKNKNTAKWIIVICGLAISAALVVMIGAKFKTPPVEDVAIPSTSSVAQDVVVEKPREKDDFEIPPFEISEPAPTNNGDDDGTEQTIQPDPIEKPNPTEDELTDSTQTPSGEKVDLPTTEEEKPVAPTPPVTEPSNPSGGLPGFDNVPKGGPNEHIIVDGDGDINKQVGIM